MKSVNSEPTLVLLSHARKEAHCQTSAEQSPRKIIPDELSRRLWGTIVDNRYTLGKSRMRPTLWGTPSRKRQKILSSQNIYNCSSLDENQLACLWNKTLDWSSESNLQWIILIKSSFKSYFAVQVQNTDTIVLWF